MFPLPFFSPLTVSPSSCLSARNRYRFKIKRIILMVTNHCIDTLNNLYHSTSSSLTSSISSFSSSLLKTSLSSSSFSLSQPDIFSSPLSSCHKRLLARIYNTCYTFVLRVRALPVRDSDMKLLDLFLKSFEFAQSKLFISDYYNSHKPIVRKAASRPLLDVTPVTSLPLP